MKSSFLRLLTTAAVALAITSVTSFAAETEKKKDDDKSPCCPTEAPKSQITNHCGKCEKKDEPTTAPATEPAKTEPVKSQECPDKKDGEKCPPAPTEAPKA